MVQEAAVRQGFAVGWQPSAVEGEDFSVKPTQLVITPQLPADVETKLMEALNHMSYCNLDMKIINKSSGK